MPLSAIFQRFDWINSHKLPKKLHHIKMKKALPIDSILIEKCYFYFKVITKILDFVNSLDG